MDMVVVDSVAALVPKAELAGEMGDHHIALQVPIALVCPRCPPIQYLDLLYVICNLRKHEPKGCCFSCYIHRITEHYFVSL